MMQAPLIYLWCILQMHKTENGFHSHSQEKDQLVAFEPLEQQQESEMKYTGFGFIPCNG